MEFLYGCAGDHRGGLATLAVLAKGDEIRLLAIVVIGPVTSFSLSPG